MSRRNRKHYDGTAPHLRRRRRENHRRLRQIADGQLTGRSGHLGQGDFVTPAARAAARGWK